MLPTGSTTPLVDVRVWVGDKLRARARCVLVSLEVRGIQRRNATYESLQQVCPWIMLYVWQGLEALGVGGVSEKLC